MKIGTLNLQYYLHPKRGLKLDAITYASKVDGVVTINREFFSIRTWLTHYVNELVTWKPHFDIIWLPVLKNDLLEIKLPFSFAIGFDAAEIGSTANSDASSLTFSHTSSSGSNTAMANLGYGGRGDSNMVATYNGVSLTRDFGTIKVGQHLVAPASGTHNFVFTDNGGGSSTLRCSVITLTGAAQVGTVDGTNTGAATLSINVTTAKDNTYIIDGCLYDSNFGSPGTPTAGQTQINTQEIGTGLRTGFCSSYKATTTAGTYSMGWTGISTSSLSHFAIAIREFTTVSKTASASVSNAVSRLAALRFSPVRIRLSATVSNAASRLATLARIVTYKKAAIAMVSNAASRLSTLYGFVAYRLLGKSANTTNTFGGKSTDSTNTFSNKSTDSTDNFIHKS